MFNLPAAATVYIRHVLEDDIRHVLVGRVHVNNGNFVIRRRRHHKQIHVALLNVGKVVEHIILFNICSVEIQRDGGFKALLCE